MKTPREPYAPSGRKLPDVIPTLDYALCDDVITVNRGGRIRFGRNRKCAVGAALAGETVGVRDTGPDFWLVAFLTVETQIGQGSGLSVSAPVCDGSDPAGVPAGTRANRIRVHFTHD